MKIILARHGDTSETDNKFHGETDEPLSGKGRVQAYALARQLKKYNPNVIFTSPVNRCKDTAKILGNELGATVKTKNELKCLDLGNFVGKDPEKYLSALKQYLSNPNEQIPGGESVNDFAQRYLPFFEKYNKNPDNGSVVFLTHGRNILLSKAYLDKGGLAPEFDKKTLTDNDKTTEHGGYAIADGNSFKIVTPQAVPAGRS